MKFVADEGVDKQIIDLLRQQGLEVLYIAETSSGISDPEVLEIANREKALLLTTDKDFGELVFRQGKIAPGIILIRLAGLQPEDKAKIVTETIQEYGAILPEKFTVITPENIRIRTNIPQKLEF